MVSMSLGRVVGKSAYEMAVEKGFVGTEAAWLTSLRGPIGLTGTGIQGPPGPPGPPGSGGGSGGSDTGRIQWLTQAEYSQLQFNNQLNPIIEYHITDRPTAYELRLVGAELRMVINGTTVATCNVTSLLNV